MGQNYAFKKFIYLQNGVKIKQTIKQVANKQAHAYEYSNPAGSAFVTWPILYWQLFFIGKLLCISFWCPDDYFECGN